MIKTRHHIELTPEVIFKAEFKKAFLPKIIRSLLIADGKINFSPSWKDVVAYLGINSASIVSAGVVTILAGTCIVPALLVPAITVPVSLAGAAGYIGFVFYRLNKKAKEYRTIAQEWHDRDVDRDADMISDTLVTLYSQQINYLDRKSIAMLADAFSEIILYVMMKNKSIYNVDDLIDPAKMQHFLLTFANHIPKEKMTILLDDGMKRNIRGAITKAGIFCEENATIYVDDKSKPAKYGVVTFKALDDLKTFSFFEPEKKYHQLKKQQKKELLSYSIFKEHDVINAYITDSVYKDVFYFPKK